MHWKQKRLVEGTVRRQLLAPLRRRAAGDGPEDRDDTLAVGRAALERETERRAKDEGEEREPADAVAGHLGQLEERVADARRPGSAHRPAKDARIDKAKEDEADKEPGEDGRLDPPVPGRLVGDT